MTFKYNMEIRFLQKPIYRGPMVYLLLIAGLLLNSPALSLSQDSAESDQCIACHTKARKLIEISRIIKQTRPARQKSARTSGEG